MVVIRDNTKFERSNKKCESVEQKMSNSMDQMNVWNQKKEQARLQKIREQRENRELLDKFWPWGQQIKARGMGNLRMDEIFPNDELQKSKRLTGLLHLGKPGCGAPHRIRTIEDPVLRFQWSKDLKRTVDNNIRYKRDRVEQEEYKKQLDKLVQERRKLKEKEKHESLKQDRALLAKTPPWGKPGPGGILWRQPKDIGLNFMKSMGWSDEVTLEQIENDYKDYKDKTRTNIDSYNRLKGGQRYTKENLKNNMVNIKPYRLNPLSVDKANGDLVNVIAKKRYHPIVPLTTTDITKANLTYFIDVRKQNKIHLEELMKQMKRKVDNAKQVKEDDLKISRIHFETWNSFWGRPGHGAPLPETKKGHIEKMLFPSMMPVAVA